MAIFDELKTIGKILQEAGKIEQYQQILETQEKLLEMQKKIIDLENENQKLKEQLDIKDNLIYKEELYWLKNGSYEDGPFCSRCWDVNKKLVRAKGRRNNGFICPECNHYTGSGVSISQPEIRNINRGR